MSGVSVVDPTDFLKKHITKHTKLKCCQRRSSVQRLFQENLKQLSFLFMYKRERIPKTCLIPLSYLLKDVGSVGNTPCIRVPEKVVQLVESKKGLFFFLTATSKGGSKRVFQHPRPRRQLLRTAFKRRDITFRRRSIPFYEKVLYNPQHYTDLPKHLRNKFHQDVLDFERSWRFLHFLCCLVQDHTSHCENSGRWVDENRCVSFSCYKYHHQCSCPYKQCVSFLFVPLHVDLVRLRERTEMTTRDERQALKALPRESQKNVLYSITVQQENEDSISSGIPAKEKKKKEKITKQVLHKVSIPFEYGDGGPDVGQSKMYRRITPEFCLMSRPCDESERAVIDLVLCFSGRDMLAVDWLHLIDQCLCSYVAEKWLKGSNDNSLADMFRAPSLKKKPIVRSVSKISRKVSGFDPKQLYAARRHQLRRGRRRLEGSTLLEDSKTSSESSRETTDQKNINCRTTFFVGQRDKPMFPHTTSCGFVIVEYPGYGSSFGFPSPTSCVDSALEAIRQCFEQLKPASVRLHFIGYSLGCAIALRVLILLGEFLSVSNSTQRDVRDIFSCVQSIPSVILIGPFTTSSECLAHALRIPTVLKSFSSFLWNCFGSSVCHYDNIQCIRFLARLISKKPLFFSKFSLTIVVGSHDTITPEEFGIRLATQFKKAVQQFVLKQSRIQVHCVKIHQATHSSIFDPFKLTQIFKKYHNAFVEHQALERDAPSRHLHNKADS